MTLGASERRVVSLMVVLVTVGISQICYGEGALAVTVREPDGSTDIYVVPLASVNSPGVANNVTSNPAKDVSPRWSPDGQEILSISDRDGDDALYITDRNGLSTRRLTQDPRISGVRLGLPDWSINSEKELPSIGV